MENSKIIEKALSYYGLNEIEKGVLSTKVKIMLSEVTGVTHTSNISWCAAFVGYVLKQLDLEYSHTLVARHYLKLGRVINEPKVGDIVVISNLGSLSWSGHVGFFVSKYDENIYILGGNQSNRVCISPFQASSVLGYRRLGNSI